MVWDFCEANPFSESSGNFRGQVGYLANVLAASPHAASVGSASQADATRNSYSGDPVVSTDPPYYDNIGYADLSDFFYVWLRRTLRPTFPNLFATVAAPKTEELVATPHRHGSKEAAESFFLVGIGQVLERLAKKTRPAFPVTIYYAYKQSERKSDAGMSSTGWETFLEALVIAIRFRGNRHMAHAYRAY